MPLILDIFDNAAFSALSLTDSVNIVPNLYGRVGQLGIFRDEPIPTTMAAIILENGVLNVLPTRPRGAAPTYGTSEKRHLKGFVVPHIPHDDAVLTTDVQNMLAWSNGGLSPVVLETVLGYVNRKLITMRRKHAITLESLRSSALTGVMLDADGSVIFDYYDEFGIAPPAPVDFALGTPSTDVGGVCDNITGYMEDNLLGDTMTSVHCLASPQFMQRVTAHATVKQAYTFFNAGNNPLRNDVRKMFPFHGIMFEEYRGYYTVLNEDNTTTTKYLVPPGDARFFPMGTTETFVNYWAPPDFISEVNEAPPIGAQVFVAPLEPMKFGKGMEIHTESNPLPVVKRPQLLVRGFSSN